MIRRLALAAGLLLTTALSAAPLVRELGDGLGYARIAQLPDDLPDTEGHGLGLANTRARLEALYGGHAALDVASTAAGGTRVSLRLPHAAARTHAALASGAPASPALQELFQP